MTPQQKILNALSEHNQLTKKELLEIICHEYYANSEKHVADSLRLLVKNQTIKRVKRGVYRIETSNPNQMKLF